MTDRRTDGLTDGPGYIGPESGSNKHLFGAVSSPSIANYIVKRLGTDNVDKYGEDVRKVMEREFYVDNRFLSSLSTTDAISMLNRTISACEEGRFNIRKVSSNSPAVVQSVPSDKRASSPQHYELGKMLTI